jgi:signal transduction histidine kinase
MNSSAPILSLIQIVNQKLLEGEQVRTLNEKDQRNMAISLRGIEDRTSGMLNFVKAYRIVNREISPNRAMVHLDTLRNSIQGQLEGFKTQYPDANLELRIDKAVEVWIDLDLMSQVLINLIKNALEATVDQDAPQVFIDIKPNDRDLIIAVADNGEGVNADTESDIFVPFFTTKKDGSGIGLALSRKIVRAHQGQLTYSREAEFSRFEIRLADALLPQSIS